MVLKPDSELLTVSIASNIKMTLVHKVLPTMVQYRLWFTENPFYKLNYIDKCILKVTLGYFIFLEYSFFSSIMILHIICRVLSVCVDQFRCSRIVCCLLEIAVWSLQKKLLPWLVMNDDYGVCVCERESSLNNRIACLLWGHQRQSLLFLLPFHHFSIQPVTNRPKVQWTDVKHIVPVCLLSKGYFILSDTLRSASVHWSERFRLFFVSREHKPWVQPIWLWRDNKIIWFATRQSHLKLNASSCQEMRANIYTST